jgi:hypothetical protein
MTHSIRIVAIVIAAIGFCCLAALSFAQSVPAGCAQWIKVDEKTICFEDYISKLNFFTDYSKSHPSIGCCRWWCGSDGKADCDVGGGGGGNAPDASTKICDTSPGWLCRCKSPRSASCERMCTEAMGWTASRVRPSTRASQRTFGCEQKSCAAAALRRTIGRHRRQSGSTAFS